MTWTIERFEERWEPEPTTGCWLWTGPAFRDGYGNCRLAGAGPLLRNAHRIAWYLYRGTHPGDLFVLHRCDTPACVNPDHLFLGTHEDNMEDARQKGRMDHPAPIDDRKLEVERRNRKALGRAIRLQAESWR